MGWEEQPRAANGQWGSGGFSAAGVTLKAVPVSKNKKGEGAQYFANRATFHAGKHYQHVVGHGASPDDITKAKYALAAQNSLKRMKENVDNAQKTASTPQEKVYAQAAKMMYEKSLALHSTIETGKKPAEKVEHKPDPTVTKVAPVKEPIKVEKDYVKQAENALQAEKHLATAEKALKFAKEAQSPIEAGDFYANAKDYSQKAMALTANPEKSSTLYPKAAKIYSEAKTGESFSKVKDSLTSGKNKSHMGDAKPHMDHEEFLKARKEFTKKLTSEEKAAVLHYSGSGYAALNKDLRTSKGEAPQHASLIKSLDSALAKGAAKEEMVVFRGENHPERFAGKGPGDSYIDHGYMSTSNEPSSAFGGEVFMHLTVPKGHPAGVIPSHHAHEKEVLLGRGSRVTINKIEKIGHRTVIHATVSKVE
jgi:hypothetical protein